MPVPDLPPLSSLRAFSAFALTGSVTRAGAALNVSHAAVSQQLRKLETHLGVALLDRSNRQMTLTPEGVQLARVLEEGFGRMAQVIEAVTGADAERPLQISCTPSFGAIWLMPRLAEFRQTAPEVELMINPSPAFSDPAPGGVDVALRYGTGPWPGLDCEFLLAAPLVVVGAPSLFNGTPPQSPEELLDYPWLQEFGESEAQSWQSQLGVTGPPRAGVLHVPGNLMIDGVRQGQGLALTTRPAVEEDIASGRLLLLFEGDRDRAYHIVTAPGVPRPPLKTFLKWLRKAARK
ncbi:LysR family transcriptional regulator [Aestuariicoccus sp. MJ-SS9]|uniref:LysR family transcriptional regulator n=1 Tax=Aestuariicoccus sp. MJ-SS9 TaxID=3079855 RepID=UPI002910EC67|nr:LysR family transcriptional regulator [Aestuariicoccus sp. MJ-SS9]MDU8911839.1 LysR family transcriptional regulator [Aestuariicoccus sp. MJ-SS9]